MYCLEILESYFRSVYNYFISMYNEKTINPKQIQQSYKPIMLPDGLRQRKPLLVESHNSINNRIVPKNKLKYD